MKSRALSKTFLIIYAFASLPILCCAQTDTIKKKSFDNYLHTRKGLFGKLAKTILTDTIATNAASNPQRNDIRFQRFKDKIIRHIEVNRLDFGVPISDTAKAVSTMFTRLSNNVHHKTLDRIIRNNLFFKRNDPVQPYVLADNERYLRDLTYLQDATISILPVFGSVDSVDVIVFTKDVLSIGAFVSSVDLNNTAVELSEENLGGTGDRLSIKTLYDQQRAIRFGYGAEFLSRNISGTFIDVYVGFQNFNNTINGNKEETIYYVKFLRPLFNVYTKWTYAFETSRHHTRNMYTGDSVYKSDLRYNYDDIDLWGGWNFDASFFDKYISDQRIRGLVGLRFLSRKFELIPGRYKNIYDSRFADITGVLASISIFAQDFYKTQFIYGFGRNEDIPEGIDLSFTTGYTKKNKKNRPYIGLKFRRSYFTEKNRYLDFTVRTEGSLYNQRFEDITVLGNIDFFNRLQNLGRWKQRTFLSAGIAIQISSSLNDPLYLESKFGLPEFSNANIEGYMRATVKAESVFYSPGSIASFRFAPFIFCNASFFTPKNKELSQSKLYTSIGGGIRTRNESLIFGTLEIKGYYFPVKNANNESFKVEFNTDLKFKYNTQLIKRPEFIEVN